MAVCTRTSRSDLPTCGHSVAGIDACKAGWVMIRRNADGCFEAPRVEETLNDLAPAGTTLIDIPIGLPDSGKRCCDLEAREKLGPRKNSVFLGVRRPLLRKKSYKDANEWGKEDGAGVSRQLWGILPKIKEVDGWITPERNRTFREGHPELSFFAAAKQPMTYHKGTAAGLAERLEALKDFIAPAQVLELMQRTEGHNVAPDDILDALALCRSAARVVLCRCCQLPADPPKDARGLAMEMVC